MKVLFGYEVCMEESLLEERGTSARTETVHDQAEPAPEDAPGYGRDTSGREREKVLVALGEDIKVLNFGRGTL